MGVILREAFNGVSWQQDIQRLVFGKPISIETTVCTFKNRMSFQFSVAERLHPYDEWLLPRPQSTSRRIRERFFYILTHNSHGYTSEQLAREEMKVRLSVRWDQTPPK